MEDTMQEMKVTANGYDFGPAHAAMLTSCAALLLFEEGRFQLDDPIEKFIPQLANRRVMCAGATSLDDTEPAKTSITIRHLMSHSSGLSYGLCGPFRSAA